jgi:hypothetical protein
VKISIQPSALADLKVGFRFYEKQKAGLGSYFLDSLYSDIDSLVLYAGIHFRQFGKYRLHWQRFPYAVYYEFHDDVVLVRAVLDLRRDPSWISRKLKRLK